MPHVLTIAQTRAALFDPQDCTDSADALALLDAVFDPLVRRVGPGRFVAGLAEEWVQEDARRTLFRLRPGAVFHDGTACDAAAVAASLGQTRVFTMGKLFKDVGCLSITNCCSRRFKF
jgi:peptide/nickel transport system substrate-binding protein